MKIEDIIREDVDLEVKRTSPFSGQTNYHIIAKDGGEVVGTLDASEFEGAVRLEHIESIKKGRGHATRMVKKLQNMFPNTEIEWGYTTEDGEKLRNSLSFKEVESEYFDDFNKLDELKKEHESLLRYAKSFDDKNTKDDEYTNLFDQINEISDQIEDLEDYLQDKQPTAKIIA